MDDTEETPSPEDRKFPEISVKEDDGEAESALVITLKEGSFVELGKITRQEKVSSRKSRPISKTSVPCKKRKLTDESGISKSPEEKDNKTGRSWKEKMTILKEKKNSVGLPTHPSNHTADRLIPTEDQKQYILKNLLPPNYEYKVCSYIEENGVCVSLTVRLRLRTIEEARDWQQAYQDFTKTTMRIDKTYPRWGSQHQNLYRIDLRCHHKTRTPYSKNRRSKNTGCRATLRVIIKRTDRKKIRSKDADIREWPMIVSMNPTHNHPIECADALGHRDVSQETTLKFVEMFKNHHSPASALEVFKFNLQMKHPDKYHYLCGDRKVVPDPQWCYRLYYKIFQSTSKSNSNIMAKLEEMINNLNSGRDEPIIKIKETENNHVCLAACTPLMKGVLSDVRLDSDIVFVDSSGNKDRKNLKLYLLMIDSSTGGLPVGCIITANENEDSLNKAFELWKSLIPESAFHGRGRRGPIVFMTGGGKMEQKALQAVFPESDFLLCTYYVLQDCWRFLWGEDHQIPREVKPRLFQVVKRMLDAEDSRTLDMEFQKTLCDQDISLHQSFVEYVKSIHDEREQWSLCFKQYRPLRKNGIKNYNEAAARVLKDRIMSRFKNFNILQLTDFIMNTLNCYYGGQLPDTDTGAQDVKPLRYTHMPHNMTENVIQRSETLYQVPCENNSDRFYEVDINLGLCTCPTGLNSSSCKHRAAILERFQAPCISVLPNHLGELKPNVHLNESESEVYKDWFAPLHADEQAESQNIKVVLGSYDEPLQMDRVEIVLGSEEADLPGTSEELRKYFSFLEKKINENPDMFLPAVKAFLQNGRKLETESALASALHAFGR